MRRRPLRLALLLLGLAAAGPSRGQGVAVEGVDAARLLPPPRAAVADYANAGYRLIVRDGEAVVESRVEPLQSAAPFTTSSSRRGRRGDAVATVARGAAAGAASRYAAVSRVLGWVAANVRYELDRGADQSPPAVLGRRSAYCTGVARLSVALLAALDIPAREVAGWVAPGGDGAGIAGGGFHRWIEVYYPDRGWVFSDPLLSHHFVPATYLRLASERLAEDAGGGLLLARSERLAPVDVYREGTAGVRARRNHSRQLAGALAVEAGLAEGVAELEGLGVRRTQPLRAGRGTFLGLEPGRYALRLRLGGGLTLERAVTLRGRVRAAIHLPPPALALAVAGSGAGEAR